MTTAVNPKTEITMSNGQVLAPFIVEILANIGICGRSSIISFLEPKLNDLPNPFKMEGMTAAVNILEQAIVKKTPILIWGDYDVDGVTATALLIQFFRTIHCKATYYIPNRLTEGYAIQAEPLKKLPFSSIAGEKILITVDNGISSHEGISQAKELGYTTIVTDHHIPPDEEVNSDVILNPKQKKCTFPDKNMAGVGVAFYLAMGLRSHLRKKNFFSNTRQLPNLKTLLDLVAVGTVADMVPLNGINRTLVKAGMEIIGKTGNIGLSALCRTSNVIPRTLSSEDISFQLAPKINAAGRLGKVELAMDLLLTESKQNAKQLAKDLSKNNDSRKLLTLSEIDDALHDIAVAGKRKTSVIFGSYHIGVAGIVASKLVEKFNTPSIVLCKSKDNIFKGSARSIPGVNIHLAIKDCSDLLMSYGGHPMAAGLSITYKNINPFLERFEESVTKQLTDKPPIAIVEPTINIPIKALFLGKDLRQLQRLEPFGQGNPQPIFRDTTTTFSEIKQIGRDKDHLRMKFVSGNNIITEGVAFGLGHLANECRATQGAEIHYTPSLNSFRGKVSWQVMVKNITFPSQ